MVKNPPASVGDKGLIADSEDPTCHRSTWPLCPNYWACAREPRSHNYWAMCWNSWSLVYPRGRARQQEKPLQWEAWALQLEVSPCLWQLKKSPQCNKDPVQPKIKWTNKVNKNKDAFQWTKDLSMKCKMIKQKVEVNILLIGWKIYIYICISAYVSISICIYKVG